MYLLQFLYQVPGFIVSASATQSNSDAKKLSEVIHDSDTPDLAKESCADRLGPKRARLHPGVNKGRKQHFDLSGSGKDSFLEIAVRTGAYATWSLLGNSSSFGLFDELGPVDFVFTLGGNKTVAGLTKQRSAEAKQSEGRRRIVIDVTEVS
ncbi:unnamed protein product [Protopolystoma xenopodis]|uniref:Uncharacterized protein n=1 Tax=Protopolystoma xenopodis TaxID=117903 RepID=A0A448WK03_9PLAT|nr:unnamed protein product [Protopolystoma xenopodis]